MKIKLIRWIIFIGITIIFFGFLYVHFRTFFYVIPNRSVKAFVNWFGTKSNIAVGVALYTFLAIILLKPRSRIAAYSMGGIYFGYLIFDAYHHHLMAENNYENAWLYSFKGSQDLIYLAILFVIAFLWIFKKK
ncbi:MAG: hypothetical protein ABF289_01515 [Clostridiales bacterium]